MPNTIQILYKRYLVKIVLKAKQNIATFWGSGKPAPGIWRLLTYTVRTECEDGILLYSTVTGELILLSDREAEELSLLPCAYAPWMDQLIEKHFLVPETSDDAETVRKLRTILRMVNRSSVLTGYTILPTTACNARCFYCYENGTPCVTMTEETVRQTVRFIETHHGDRPVHINWFGGEPMVGAAQIEKICKGLKEKNIRFSSNMVSNGYLLTEEAVKQAKESWNLASVQITLDGTEEIYNRTKAYVGVTGSPYRQVLRNIEHLLDTGIRVSIRLNLDSHNAEDLKTLIPELAEQYKSRKFLSVYINPLFEDCGQLPLCRSKAETEDLSQKQAALREQLRKYGLAGEKSYLPVLEQYACMADNDTSILILPDGRLGKCDRHINDMFVGTLTEGITDQEQLLVYRRTMLAAECEKCSFFPSCFRPAACHHSEGSCTVKGIEKERNRLCGLLRKEYQNHMGR